jgi:hypothetical protein
MVGIAPSALYGRNDDFWAIHLSASFDTVWDRGWHVGHDSTRAVVIAADGGPLIVGSVVDTLESDKDLALLKLATNGDSLWFRRYGGPGNDEARDVLLMPDGGFLIAGFVTGSDNFTHACLLRTDENGDSLWQQTYGGPGSAFHALRESTYGGYVAAGYTSAYGNGGSDFLLFKFDASGDSLWSTTFGGPGDEICNAIDLTLDSGYVLAGTTTSFGAEGTDWWVVRTASDLAADDNRPQLPSAFALEQNYPNPFNPATEIRFQLGHEAEVTLRVFDLAGREVERLLDGRLSAGEHKTQFDGRALPSGVYFYQLKSEEFVATKKMLLIK